ncbi:MAG: hydroxymethylbilane synthase [Planctomycetota bacterium]
MTQTDRILRIATRESPLAMWQAHYIAGRLQDGGIATELVPLVSQGDIDLRPIDGSRSVGLFTKRIQQALLDEEADVAVHSLKDLPTEPIAGLQLACVPERESIHDVLVNPNGLGLDQLPDKAVVGTGSTRRRAQLRYRRPDLDIQPLRGNVQTRLGKLTAGDYDAIVLAEAGLLRLEMDDVVRHQFTLQELLPAPGQGALGIETRAEDAEARQALAGLNDLPTFASVTAERTLLSQLHGGCLAPIAAFAEAKPDEHDREPSEGPSNICLHLRARVLDPNGTECLEVDGSLSLECKLDWIPDHPLVEAAVDLGDRLAEELIDQGAMELIRPG